VIVNMHGRTTIKIIYVYMCVYIYIYIYIYIYTRINGAAIIYSQSCNVILFLRRFRR
jgi:hypothetical protein